MKKCVLPILTAALLLTGCSSALPEENGYTATNLMASYKPGTTPETEPDAAFRESQMAFAVSLFQKMAEGNESNVLLSPLSVTQALAMTANGAAGETLTQMEQVLAGGISAEDYSRMLSAYVEGTGKQLVSANSIWFDEKKTLTVKPEFLQKNADYFGADVFCTDFRATDCHNTIAVEQINNWVRINTKGRIPRMLEELNPEACMVLLNAVTFDAEWLSPYEDEPRNRPFTDVHGTEQDAQMMFTTEQYYITDGSAEGFLKYYEGQEFCFAALLPEEGMSVSEYIAGMDAQALLQTLQAPEQTTVHTEIPVFTASYDTELSAPLQMLGMSDAFDEGNADFSEMVSSEEGNVFIGEVIHKTTITVDTQGTTAAAATAAVLCEGAAMIEEETREVYLNRPFVYMILDAEQMLPVFIGVVNEVETPAE